MPLVSLLLLIIISRWLKVCLTNEGDLKHNVSLVIIIISTVCLLIASILRAIVVFQARTNFKSGPAAEPVSMYFSWVYLK